MLMPFIRPLQRYFLNHIYEKYELYRRKKICDNSTNSIIKTKLNRNYTWKNIMFKQTKFLLSTHLRSFKGHGQNLNSRILNFKFLF